MEKGNAHWKLHVYSIYQMDRVLAKGVLYQFAYAITCEMKPDALGS